MSADAGRIAAAVFHQAATLSEAQTPCRRMQGELRRPYFIKRQRFLRRKPHVGGCRENCGGRISSSGNAF